MTCDDVVDDLVGQRAGRPRQLDLEGGDVEVLTGVDRDGRGHRPAPPAVAASTAGIDEDDARAGGASGSTPGFASAITRQLRGSPYSSAAIRLRVSPRRDHASLGVVGGLEVELGELLLERLVLPEGHAERWPAAACPSGLNSVNFCWTLSTIALNDRPEPQVNRTRGGAWVFGWIFTSW